MAPFVDLCWPGTFMFGATTASKGVCTACSNVQCARGQYRVGECKGSTNGFTCATQPTCATGEYLSGATTTARGTCKPQAECQKGQLLAGAAASAPGVCEACPPAAFQGAANHRHPVCQPYAACKAEQHETAAPTSSSDRVCATSGTCSLGQYESKAPTNTTDRQCVELLQCQQGERVASAPEEDAAGSAVGDLVCGPCREGEYQDQQQHRNETCKPLPSCGGREQQEYLQGSSATVRGSCVACSNVACPANEYQGGVCNGTANGLTCTACSNVTCAANEYREGACAGRTNAYHCRKQPECAANEFLAGAGELQRGSCQTTPTSTATKPTATTGEPEETSSTAAAENAQSVDKKRATDKGTGGGGGTTGVDGAVGGQMDEGLATSIIVFIVLIVLGAVACAVFAAYTLHNNADADADTQHGDAYSAAETFYEPIETKETSLAASSSAIPVLHYDGDHYVMPEAAASHTASNQYLVPQAGGGDDVYLVPAAASNQYLVPQAGGGDDVYLVPTAANDDSGTSDAGHYLVPNSASNYDVASPTTTADYDMAGSGDADNYEPIDSVSPGAAFLDADEVADYDVASPTTTADYDMAGSGDAGNTDATQGAQASLYYQPAVGADAAEYEDTSTTGANGTSAAADGGGAQASLYYQPALNGSEDYEPIDNNGGLGSQPAQTHPYEYGETDTDNAMQGNEEEYEGFGIF